MSWRSWSSWARRTTAIVCGSGGSRGMGTRLPAGAPAGEHWKASFRGPGAIPGDATGCRGDPMVGDEMLTGGAVPHM